MRECEAPKTWRGEGAFRSKKENGIAAATAQSFLFRFGCVCLLLQLQLLAQLLLLLLYNSAC